MNNKYSLCLIEDKIDGKNVEFIAIEYKGILFARGPNIPTIDEYLIHLIDLANKQLELEKI